MKLAIAATPEVAIPTLDALLHSDHEIAFVITKPDSKSGRGQKILPSPVAVWSHANKVGLLQPISINEIADQLREIDLVVTIGYGSLIGEEILTLPRFGFINLHFSLLPRWRGAAPVQRAIEAGDEEVGVSVFRLDKGMDTGPIFRSARISTPASSNTGELFQTLALLGVGPVLESIAAIANGEEPKAQDENGATHAFKLSKEEGRLDWSQEGPALVNKIKAFSPHPGAWTIFRDEKLIVEKAALGDQSIAVGAIVEVENMLYIGCRNGSVQIFNLRSAGKRSLSARDWLNGARLKPNEVCT